MFRILGILIVLLAIVAAVGFYRGWFQFSENKYGDKPNVTLTVDKNKLESDKKDVKEKVEDMSDRIKGAETATRP